MVNTINYSDDPNDLSHGSNVTGPDYDENGVIYFGKYHPYRNGFNPQHDDYSSCVLKLKKGGFNIGKQDKTLVLFELLSSRGILQSLFGEVFSLAIVPSSNKEKTDTGIRQLATELVGRERDIHDITHALIRYKTIASAHSGLGSRTIKTHMNSITVNKSIDIPKWPTIVMDDVTTSGVSLLACQKILIKHGFRNTHLCALGKTVS